jgi:hypothetical protein
MYPQHPHPARKDFKAVLAAELARIVVWRGNRKVSGADVPVDPQQPLATADAMRLVGLSFSGGGIRSATFNLGVLQALAQLKVLRHVDYLSTVSGGGYIGGWLSAMIYRAKGGIDDVESGLDPDKAKADAFPQKGIARLRAFSNYLTPKVSLMSADTWSLWAIWSRNTLLNLVVLIAGIAALVLLARIFGMIGLSGFGGKALEWLTVLNYLVLTATAVTFGRNIAGKGAERWRNDKWVQILVVCPALIAAFLTTGRIFASDIKDVIWTGLIISVLYGLLQALSGFPRCFLAQHDNGFARLWDVLLQIGVALASGYATASLFYGLAKLMGRWLDPAYAPWLLLTIGPPAVLLVLSLGVILNVGLMGRDIPDDIREWIGRLGAWTTIYAMGWLLVFGGAIWAPGALIWVGALAKSTITGAWVATTIGSLLAGKSSKTSGTPQEKVQDKGGISNMVLKLLVSVGPYVFMAGFVVAIALGVHELVKYPAYPAPQNAPQVLTPLVQKPVNQTQGWDEYWRAMNSQRLSTVLQALWEGRADVFANDWYAGLVDLMLLSGAIAVLMSWRVDINEFSLHHFYKNRIVRCYLGSSLDEDKRHPNPFTKFYDGDDLRLNRLDNAQFSGPFPIINATLNLSSGRNLAWQERKGASFIFTPVFSGYDTGRGDSGTSANRKIRVGIDAKDGYWPTRDVAKSNDGGIMLGTCVAISGAAASPNQGYHTSTAIAFIMTVFNVRLGWWLGNPAQSKPDWSSPTFGLPYTVMELFGTTDANSAFVNLSDGGHFDNMGLYELIRRRCRYIIVCDAEQDETLSFGGLATAIRMCRTDFGVEIKIDLSAIARKPDNRPENFSGSHCAIGTVYYPDGPHGRLIYLKSSLTGNEPADVLGYHRRVPAFPHESTADQWFDESQFESYRRLGLHIGEHVFRSAGVGIGDGKDAFFTGLDARKADGETA